MPLSKTEGDFIEQYARVFLVEWCCQTIASGSITAVEGHIDLGLDIRAIIAQLCLEHAVEKGWVGSKAPQKVLAKGFSTAAAFLKR